MCSFFFFYCVVFFFFFFCSSFFFQAEDGIRDLVRSRGLRDVYKRQVAGSAGSPGNRRKSHRIRLVGRARERPAGQPVQGLSLIHI